MPGLAAELKHMYSNLVICFLLVVTKTFSGTLCTFSYSAIALIVNDSMFLFMEATTTMDLAEALPRLSASYTTRKKARK
jgi:hypothetical protein